MRKALAHIATVALLLAAFLVAPMAAYADVAQVRATLFGGEVDLVSSATAIQPSPDGHFTICINASRHQDESVRADWVTFLTGAEDAPLIMEDLSCVVVQGDVAGIEMAESLQSRLAENQMTVRQEEAPLALSKAEAGLFDVLVLSDDAVALYGAESVEARPDVVVIHR